MARGRKDLPPGPGRPKGSKNKATTKAREAIAALVENKAEKVEAWLDEIYETKGPEAALNSFLGFIEFHIPKLARTEHSGRIDSTVEVCDEDRAALAHFKMRVQQEAISG